MLVSWCVTSSREGEHEMPFLPLQRNRPLQRGDAEGEENAFELRPARGAGDSISP